MHPGSLNLALAFALAAPLAAFAAPQAKDANGANPTDIAASDAAGGAIIDKTHRNSGPASGAAPKETRYLKHANEAASAASASDRKRRPTPVQRGASTSM